VLSQIPQKVDTVHNLTKFVEFMEKNVKKVYWAGENPKNFFYETKWVALNSIFYLNPGTNLGISYSVNPGDHPVVYQTYTDTSGRNYMRYFSIANKDASCPNFREYDFKITLIVKVLSKENTLIDKLVWPDCHVRLKDHELNPNGGLDWPGGSIIWEKEGKTVWRGPNVEKIEVMAFSKSLSL